ncbi:GIY-YIG nuclease family protein [Heliorestis acidaminivorans]|uniref:GIY-YIG nuclease family protein n=1 Tax=Heliorestis acidaminivorans TaxID=553427 RepID=A0A6I0F4U7_9FIRM|nr:GIY-YIG nuclease family protein [Heliorestis acidaminivorans]KAB2953707.1 GIY-YIG nuclease family protein [Heliorestis acidaminivorans]
MKIYGKKITMLLIDGDPNGRLTCELSNWTGKAYKIPRTMVKDSSDRNELNSSGVYLLFGKDEAIDKEAVYIGESENILVRLKQHLKKDFWNESLIIISKDDNLNKAHIRYLEQKMIESAGHAMRYQVLNDFTPIGGTLSEADIAELEEFLDNIKLLVSTLGYKVFDELKKSTAVKRTVNGGDESGKNNKSVIFYIKGRRGADAEGRPTAEGFVVFKGSKITRNVAQSLPPWMKNLREKLINEKVLIEVNDEIVFSKDHLFSSASTAASIVLGSSSSGQRLWKLPEGISLSEYESSLTNQL